MKMADAYESNHEIEQENVKGKNDHSIARKTQNLGLAKLLDQSDLDYSMSAGEAGTNRKLQ